MGTKISRFYLPRDYLFPSRDYSSIAWANSGPFQTPPPVSENKLWMYPTFWSHVTWTAKSLRKTVLKDLLDSASSILKMLFQNRQCLTIHFWFLHSILQCLLFYKEGETLAGNKKKVYVLLKILKKCTNADITSFKVRIKTCSVSVQLLLYDRLVR